MEMKNIRELGLETIQLDDQVLLVDRKSRIRNGDFILGGADDESFHEIWVMDNHFISEEDCKVLASTKPLEGLPLLVTEDEVDSIVESEFKIKHPSDETHWKKALWKDGYATAKETYKFTEEDLREAICEAWNSCEDNEDEETFTQVFNRIIQSITKKELCIEVEEKSIEEIEIELGIYGHDEGLTESEYSEYIKKNNVLKLKIANNQIKAVWK